MEIIISRHELLSKMQNVGRIIEANKAIPELEAFKIDIQGDEVKITGANTEGSISSKLDCELRDAHEVSFILESKIIINGLKEIPEQPITINVDKTGIVFYYNNGNFKMPFIASSIKNRDISKPNQSVTLNSDVLTSGLKTCSKFTSKDILRPVMQNVNIDFFANNREIAFAGTTGHSLAVKKIELDGEQDFQVNFPSRAAKAITDILGNKSQKIALHISDRSVEAVFDQYVVNYRLFEGRFPNYNAVIPNHPYQLEIERDNFISAIKRVSVFSEITLSLIILFIKDGTLKITGRDMNLSRFANEEMPCKFNGNEMKIGFNAKLLLDILTTMESEKVILSILDESKAGIFTPKQDDGSLFLLMPMAVND